MAQAPFYRSLLPPDLARGPEIDVRAGRPRGRSFMSARLGRALRRSGRKGPSSPARPRDGAQAPPH